MKHINLLMLDKTFIFDSNFLSKESVKNYLGLEDSKSQELLTINKLCKLLKKYFNQIYGNEYYSLDQIIKAWECRKYDPIIVFGWREASFFETFENEELEEYNRIEKNVHILYEKYHTKEYIENYNKMIQIEPLEIFDSKSLRILQNCMINFLNNKTQLSHISPSCFLV